MNIKCLLGKHNYRIYEGIVKNGLAHQYRCTRCPSRGYGFTDKGAFYGLLAGHSKKSISNPGAPLI